MGDKDKIDSSDIIIGDITLHTDATTEYDDWLQQYTSNLDPDIDDWIFPNNSLVANDIKLTGGGQEMLRIAEDGFYVNGVKVKQGKHEAKAVYEAFKSWMTYAILNGEINN
jgi:hypothetical protein